MKKAFLVFSIVLTLAAIALQVYVRQLRRDPVAIAGDFGGRAAQSTDGSGAMTKFSEVPDFTLTDRSGASIKLADLKGKVWLADFVYTTCPDTCPMLGNRFSELQGVVAAAGDVRLVSFSVDPEHDTPSVLQGYASHLKAGDRWLFLTGNKAQVLQIATKGFLLGFASSPVISGTSGGISHSTKIALVDSQGAVRRFYDGVGPGAADNAQILADVKSLLKEAALTK